MSNIDDRIVNMEFKNSTFERAAAITLGTLAKLKSSLNFSASKKGLDDLQATSNKFNMNGLTNATSGVLSRFRALPIVFGTVVATMTHQAFTAGERMVKALTVDPILTGLSIYETKLNSIQTILANTGLRGKEGLGKVNDALNVLNKYSNQTIYNFGQMAKNIGTFTAAGLGLKESTQAIKGIANLAAISGSSSEQASTAMYQLSQALASGTVKLMDWNSVVNAGMGGKVFQNALMETARVHGVAIDSMLKEDGSFRNTLQRGWLTSSILSETLNKFTGDLNAKQLKAQGYTDEQIKKIQQLGKTAVEAATKVKTLPQLLDVLKESVATGWATTFETIFGNINEAKKLFTSVNDVVGGFITQSANARNKVLGDWKKLGGRTALIEGIGNVFKALGSFIKPIHDAFRDIFPAKTGQDLLHLTVMFSTFFRNLQLGAGASENLRRTARGLFAVLDIGWQIVKGLVGVVFDLFRSSGDAAGGFLEFTGGIGDFLVKLDEALKKGKFLDTFFGGLSTVLRIPIQLLTALGEVLGGLFEGKGSDAAGNALGRLTDRMSPLGGLLHTINKAWGIFVDLMGKAAGSLAPLLAGIGAAFSKIGTAVADGMASGNFDAVFDVLNTTLLGGILLLIQKFLKNGFTIKAALGFTKPIEGAFSQLTDTMKSMQTQIQAKTLLLIAGAIALLTASVVALSLIDSRKLTKALTAMSIGFGQLLAAMAILVKISGSAGFVKVPTIAASMVLLSASLLILTAAVAAMGQLRWETIGKGLAGIAGALLVIGTAMQLMPATLPLTGAGLVLVGAGLTIIAGAMAIFGQMQWKTIGKGLVGIAGALLVIAGAMQLMPVNLPITAAGLILVSIALEALAGVAATFATMSWKQLGKAAVAIAGALLIIAGGLALMSGTLLGSAALLVASAALAVLTPVLLALGNMSWEAIIRGLTTLAATFLIFGAAGLILAPLIPEMLGLAAAVALLGAGLALAGVGVLAFATAFTLLTAAGVAGVTVLTATVGAVAGLIPLVMQKLAEGMLAFAQVITTNGPILVAAFVTVFNSLLDAVIKTTPKLGRALTVLIQTGLKVLRDNFPAYVKTGLQLIVNLLQGIANAIPKIAHSVANIIIAWLNAIAKEYPRIIDAGFKALIKFIDGISDAIDANSKELGEAGARMGISIAKGVIKGLAGMAGEVAKEAGNLGKKALGGLHNIIKNPPFPSREGVRLGGSLGYGFAYGISTYGKVAERSAEGVAQGALDKIQASLARAQDFVPDVNLVPVIRPVLDLSDIQKNAPKINSLLTANPVSAKVSYSAAKAISADTQSAKSGQETATSETKLVEMKFEQNLHSPEALSDVDIYRQTKNQWSQAKKAIQQLVDSK